MDDFAMRDPLRSRLTLSKAYEQFQTALAKYAGDEAAGFEPVDVEDRLLRVLIVDDYRCFTDTLSNLVRAWGHDVRCAYEGAAGLALATKYKPDVVLLGSDLPGMSGIELALKVRQQKCLKHCFIIAVSGRADSMHSDRCYEAGVDLCLTKSIAPSQIQMLLMLESEYVLSRRESTAATFGNVAISAVAI